jgi:glycosyltransferase involved in cell wall biosynthesis
MKWKAQRVEVMKRKSGRVVDSNVPKVTIGIPTYNGGRKLQKALTSIFNQEYDNLEVIVSDNCSTDDTEEVCTGLAQRHPDVVKYYRQPVNRGVTANYQFVLEKATGDYFMWLADDDTLAHGILRKYVDFLIHNPDYSLVSGQVKYWQGAKLVLVEKDMSLDQSSPYLRVLNYYYKVMYGAMIYGLMNRRLAQSIPLRNRIGDDWHYVASVAFHGKVKNLEIHGYNKKFGGVSVNMKNYAKVIGANWFSANFPHATIAVDALAEVILLSPQYAKLDMFSRVVLGFFSCVSVLTSHYLKVFPFIVGGKIKRLVRKPYENWITETSRT